MFSRRVFRKPENHFSARRFESISRFAGRAASAKPRIMTFSNPIFAAIDTPDLGAAQALGRQLAPICGGLKLGLEFYSAQGPQGFAAMTALGAPIFADLKFHDIPNTVAGAVRAISKTGIAIVNVHATGGRAMMAAAVKAAEDAAGAARPKVIGVTVLTSLDNGDMAETGVRTGTGDQALRLAALARDAGLDGVVCSPHEIAAIRRECGPGLMLIVPGVRPAGAALGDQKRVMTPVEAHRLGADVLVVGRPITEAADPAAAARAIRDSLLGAAA
jgi:orotidine-5'-phosphate decarboxylase